MLNYLSKMREKEPLECRRVHIWALKTQKLPGPSSGPWTPATKGSLRSHDSASLRWQLSASEAGAPPWQNPGSTPGEVCCPPDANYINFMQFGGKIGKIVCWCPPSTPPEDWPHISDKRPGLFKGESKLQKFQRISHCWLIKNWRNRPECVFRIYIFQFGFKQFRRTWPMEYFLILGILEIWKKKNPQFLYWTVFQQLMTTIYHITKMGDIKTIIGEQ